MTTPAAMSGPTAANRQLKVSVASEAAPAPNRRRKIPDADCDPTRPESRSPLAAPPESSPSARSCPFCPPPPGGALPPRTLIGVHSHNGRREGRRFQSVLVPPGCERGKAGAAPAATRDSIAPTPRGREPRNPRIPLTGNRDPDSTVWRGKRRVEVHGTLHCCVADAVVCRCAIDEWSKAVSSQEHAAFTADGGGAMLPAVMSPRGGSGLTYNLASARSSSYSRLGCSRRCVRT